MPRRSTEREESFSTLQGTRGASDNGSTRRDVFGFLICRFVEFCTKAAEYLESGCDSICRHQKSKLQAQWNNQEQPARVQLELVSSLTYCNTQVFDTSGMSWIEKCDEMSEISRYQSAFPGEMRCAREPELHVLYVTWPCLSDSSS